MNGGGGGGGSEATESAFFFFFYFETWFLLLQFFSVDTQTLARALLSRAFAFASVCLRVFVCVVSSRIRRRRRSQRSVCVCVFIFLAFFPSFSHLFLTAVQFLFHFQTARLQPVFLCFHSLPPYHLTLPCLASLHHHHHLPWSSLSVTHLIGLFYVYVYVYSPYHHLFLSVCLFCWRLPHQQRELLHCSISVSSVYPQWYPSSLPCTHQSNTHTTREGESA